MTAGAPRCLVTGATGFIGRHLVGALCDRGYHVRCLVRETSDVSPLAGLPVTFAHGDLTNPGQLEKAVEDIDLVFHAGGAIRAWRQNDFETINGAGTGWLLEACRRAAPGLRRFVLVSSLAACGPNRDACAHREDVVPFPCSDYGRSKRYGELITLSYAHEVPATVIRPPVVYGPWDRQLLPLFRMAALGLRPTLGDVRYSMVHVDDLVTGLVRAAESGDAAGRTYFMAARETPTLAEITGAISDALGRPSVGLPVPFRLAWYVGSVAQVSSTVLRRPILFDRHRARDFYQSGWCCDSALAREELGFNQKASLADGLRETALWYKERGWLR